MANRVYLTGLNENFFEDDDVAMHALVERNYAIPLLWFGLFEPEDLKLYSDVPILLTSRDRALASLRRRAPGLKAFLGDLAAPVVDDWITFIEQNAYANYLLNTLELAQMEDEEGEFRRDLEQYQAEFETIAAGTFASRELGVLLQETDQLAQFPYAGAPLHLCGYSFDLELPWERKAA